MENYFDEEVSAMPEEVFSLRGPLEEYSVYIKKT